MSGLVHYVRAADLAVPCGARLGMGQGLAVTTDLPQVTCADCTAALKAGWGNARVRCVGCHIDYVTGLDSWDERACRCPACGESKAQLLEER